MRDFPLCEPCRTEYEDPADRRFHAEPIACPDCGPRLAFHAPDGSGGDGDPLARAVAMLLEGEIVALKGLGGFHLACNASDEGAVARLRERKLRPDKPFAVMVTADVDLDRWFEVSEAERRTLSSWRAPIVLVRDRGHLAPSVAPGHHRQGAMLPSSPLHHLLTRDAGIPLVMTSGNASDEPICTDNQQARQRLADIADGFLFHDRPIVSRYDDSVTLVRNNAETPSVLRRARSFAPHPVRLATPLVRPVLGAGAELHGAFCLAAGSDAYLSQHIGDLDSDAAMSAYREALDRGQALFDLRPDVVAHDLHPDFLTTRFAQELGLPCVPVQHHHAHVVATMAEHGLEGEVLGIAFDGFGLGTDGTAWGGEFLRCSTSGFARIGRLRPVPQPGGDAATAHPWRMAASHLRDAELLDKAGWFIGAPDPDALRVVLGQMSSGLASPPTSSAGRLFDAVASLLGICRNATYEGQPAVLLEQAALPRATPTNVSISERGGLLELDTRDLIAPIVDGLRRGEGVAKLAGAFHASLASATADMGMRLAADHGMTRVALGGGVFANDLLTADLVQRLTHAGLEVFLPREVPVGDGGIALGQAVVAGALEAV
jgi:hydrogenase maturation protein HypF